MTTIYVIGGVILLVITLFIIYGRVMRARGASDVKQNISEHELKVDKAIQDEYIKSTTLDDTINSLRHHDY